MKTTARALLAAALSAPWLLIWQGVDFTDQGYLLTTYRCFFHSPELVEDSGSVWLTALIGGVWDALFGGLGVLGMRALWALCSSVALWVVFRSLRAITGATAAAAAVASASLFLADRRETWFSYNTSSALLFVLCAIWIVNGVTFARRRTLVGAGVLLGLMPLARVPNVLGLALAATALLAAWLERRSFGRLARNLADLALGTMAGLGAGLLGVRALGHWPYFVTSLRALSSPDAAQSGHDAASLLGHFVKDQLLALAAGLLVCGLCLGLSRAFAKLPPRVCVLLAGVLGVLGAYALTTGDELWSTIVPGTLYWLLGSVVLGAWGRETRLRLLALAALLVLVLAPLGSNNGIRNAHVGSWLALPLGLALLFGSEPAWLVGQGSRIGLLLSLSLAGEGAHQALTYTYRDASRAQLWTAVERGGLQAQLTTPARARVVREVLDALHDRVSPGDYLLAYEGTPLLQYLTRTKPYLKRAWVMGTESGEVIARLADEAPGRTGCVPVAVLSLKSTRGSSWPLHARALGTKEPERGERAAIKAFLRAHGYRRKWSNGFFEILEPTSSGHSPCR